MGIDWSGEEEMISEPDPKVEKAREFVRKNRIAVDNSRVECIDGRFARDQILDKEGRGAIRAAGGDFGLLAAFTAADGGKVGPRGIFERYRVALDHPDVGRDGKFHVHAECGHIRILIKNNPELQGILLEVLKLGSDKKSEAVLEGSHNEKGVLIIKSSQWSVNSRDPKTDERYFTEDEKRTKELIEKVSSKMGIPHITPEKVWSQYERQRSETLSELVPKLPRFEIAFDSVGKFRLTPLE